MIYIAFMVAMVAMAVAYAFEDIFGALLYFILLTAFLWPVVRGIFGELLVALKLRDYNPWD